MNPWRFALMVLVSLVAFYAVVRFAVRSRETAPGTGLVVVLSLIVVVGGMTFARFGAGAELPLILAALMAPLVHVAFSLLLGWKEYMPFIPVPSLGEVFGG